jgi:hypothetical protein
MATLRGLNTLSRYEVTKTGNLPVYGADLKRKIKTLRLYTTISLLTGVENEVCFEDLGNEKGGYFLRNL